MSEEETYKYERLNELDTIFELTHSYGDDYPEIINRALDRIVNNEIELNQLKDRINKAIDILHNINDDLPLDLILTEIEHTEYVLKGDKE